MTATLDAEAPPEPSLPPRRHRAFYRLYYGETKFDFVRRKRVWFLVSSAVILIGVISLAVRGLNFGIDFVGGTSWQVLAPGVTVPQTEAALAPLGIGPVTVTVLGGRTINVEAKLPKGQSAARSLAVQGEVATALAHLAHQPTTAVSITSVGPTWGSEITNKAILALIVFFVLIAGYISIFFEWKMALAAIVAVLHDILVTVGIYSLTGFQVTPDTVVAFLTILGYSLYDTIVVFDRVRDNSKGLGASGKLSYSDVVNLSMNQTLARSINTSAVAIMPILAVLILGAQVLGATDLQYFGLALLIGLASGAYSSIFIASPLVALLKEHEPRYSAIRERLAARGTAELLLSPAAIAAGALGTDEASNRARRRSTSGQSSTPPPGRGGRRPSGARGGSRAGGGVTRQGSPTPDDAPLLSPGAALRGASPDLDPDIATARYESDHGDADERGRSSSERGPSPDLPASRPVAAPPGVPRPPAARPAVNRGATRGRPTGAASRASRSKKKGKRR
jgi:preprotein translocase subunit SecF